DDINLPPSKITRDICGKVAASFCPTIFYYHGAAFDPGKLAQPPNKTRHPFGFGRGGALAHISDDRQLARLLRTLRERPSRRAADQGEKLAPSHWFDPRPTTDIIRVLFGSKTGIFSLTCDHRAAVDPSSFVSATRRSRSCANCESESSRAPMTTMRSPRRASLTKTSPQALRSGKANTFRPCRSISQIISRLPTLRSTVPPKYMGSGMTKTSSSCNPFVKQSTRACLIKRIGP